MPPSSRRKAPVPKAPALPVPDGLVNSATRVMSYLDCPRLWWYNAHMEGGLPATDAMARGTRVHAAIEALLVLGHWPEGASPDMAEAIAIAKAGTPLLGPLRAAVKEGFGYVETPFLADLGVIPFQGTIDFFADRLEVGLERWGPTVIDHKTTSDLRAPWHLDAAGMKRNLQLLLYAAHAWNPVPPEVRIGHFYYLTKGEPRTRDLVVRVQREEIENARDRARHLSEDMLRHFHAPERKVPVRTQACRKYGGCPHRAVCPDSPMNQQVRAAAYLEAHRAAHKARERKKDHGKPEDPGNPRAEVHPAERSEEGTDRARPEGKRR